MTKPAPRFACPRRTAAIGILVGALCAPAIAQDVSSPSSTAPSGAGLQPSSSSGPLGSDPNPYYIGVSQAFAHDSNVYRIADGPSDTYSSTSLLGGFNQRLGRQRVFGSANVSANRYFSQSDLNNVSYGLAAGLAWETIENLSGNVNVGLNRNLTAPVTTSSSTVRTRNVAETENVDLRARWGGVSLLTLEGSLGYSQINYSAPESVSLESSQDSGGLTLFYRPGGPLRVGVGGRLSRTRTPKALFDPVTGNYQPTTIHSRNIDFLADYDVSGLLAFNGRLSYTKQTNSGIADSDFSGITGSVGLVYHATGKIDVNVQASRDAGYDSSFFNSYAMVQSGQSLVLTPVSVFYQNNRVTDSVGLGATYAATAKIGVRAGVRYARAKLTTTTVASSSGSPAPETTDVSRSASLGANYAITRNWSAACNASHERRSASGGVSFAYRDTSVGCSAQLLWP